MHGKAKSVRNLCFTLAAAMLCHLSLGAFATAQMIQVENHQSFPINMPLLVRGVKVDSLSTIAQQTGDDAVVLVDVAANGTQEITPRTGASVSTKSPEISPIDDGLAIKFGDTDLGKLSWGIVFEKLTKEQAKPDDHDVASHRDFNKLFKALPLSFKQTASGNLFQTFSAEGSSDGLHLAVSLDVYRNGVIDVHTSLTNQAAPQHDVYAAVVCRWQQPGGATRSMDYDNHILPLNGDSYSPFRAGQGRQMMILRGVDWINNTFDGVSVAMLNDFTPSFTVHRNATAKTPAHWTGANTAQLGQEAQSAGETLYSITEIARPNIKFYASRLQDNILPAPGEPPLVSTSRLFFDLKPFSDSRVDQMFTAYAGFTRQTKTDDGAKIEFGVPFTRFGTAYFPYSTLGENFQKLHLPGMSGETYWPLAADTVTHYRLFADDIKRDLCIAKAMGFQTIRLHHLEMLSSLPKQAQDDYLDFLFGELKHLGLTALIDAKLPTDRVVELVKKYGPQLEGVEIDNEVLIFGINDSQVQGWKDQYAAIKAVAPDLPVWFTGHTNTGAFERLRRLGVPFDRVGEHCYADSVDAIPSMRDNALEVANYAGKIGKESVITEWNWRFLTRMTPEARAQIYPPIFEDALATRCVPEIYQFQFQESLAMAPKTLRGIRHYELLNLSRRPRPEAYELMKLMRTYGDPNAPQNVLSATHPCYELPIAGDKDTDESLAPNLHNWSDKPIMAALSIETPPGIDVKLIGDPVIEVPAGQDVPVNMSLKVAADLEPGFYHTFVRCEFEEGLSSYVWIEIQKPGAPKIDKDKPTGGSVTYANDALDYNFNRPLAIVYGKDATGWEVESAWYIWETLESATGRPARIYQSNDLPDDVRKNGNLILVGTLKSNNLIAAIDPPAKGKSYVTYAPADDSHGDTLLVVGDDEAAVSDAAMDFVLRYWRFAKDSAARRLSLTDTPLGKTVDPDALP